jgi:hypothetical protein
MNQIKLNVREMAEILTDNLDLIGRSDCCIYHHVEDEETELRFDMEDNREWLKILELRSLEFDMDYEPNVYDWINLLEDILPKEIENPNWEEDDFEVVLD